MAEVIPVALTSDLYVPRRAVKDMAVALGFDTKTSEEIAIAVRELASNLVAHRQGGKLVLTPVSEDERVGIQVESYDPRTWHC